MPCCQTRGHQLEMAHLPADFILLVVKRVVCVSLILMLTSAILFTATLHIMSESLSSPPLHAPIIANVNNSTMFQVSFLNVVSCIGQSLVQILPLLIISAMALILMVLFSLAVVYLSKPQPVVPEVPQYIWDPPKRRKDEPFGLTAVGFIFGSFVFLTVLYKLLVSKDEDSKGGPSAAAMGAGTGAGLAKAKVDIADDWMMV